jgi:hypothetical protein
LIFSGFYLATGHRASAHILVKDWHYLLTMRAAIHVIHSKRVRGGIRHLLVEKEIPDKAKSDSRI